MSVNLRKLAKDKPCFVRLSGICNGRTDTTVLAHIKNGWYGSLKPPDIVGVFACFDCHAEIDRRTREIPVDQVDLAVLRALCEQLTYYAKERIVRW